MKTLKLTFAIILFSFPRIYSQWFWQNPFLQGKEFYEVYLIHSNTGWVGGQVGTMLKTTNSGVNWTSQSSGITRRLYSVYFKDFNTGWTVGQFGTICSTTNGGVNWTEQYSGILTDLYSVYFTDSNT